MHGAKIRRNSEGNTRILTIKYQQGQSNKTPCFLHTNKPNHGAYVQTLTFRSEENSMKNPKYERKRRYLLGKTGIGCTN